MKVEQRFVLDLPKFSDLPRRAAAPDIAPTVQFSLALRVLCRVGHSRALANMVAGFFERLEASSKFVNEMA